MASVKKGEDEAFAMKILFQESSMFWVHSLHIRLNIPRCFHIMNAKGQNIEMIQKNTLRTSTH